jgi:hypothetical protein
MTATLEPGEDPSKAVKELQARAEGLVEDHKRQLLASLEELYQLSTRQAEVRGLDREIRQAQSRLDAIRAEHPGLLALPHNEPLPGAQASQPQEPDSNPV